tara:strand:+ start:14668 stop:15525 length:858 start_codon:yes stop_codon:yes gene_type:complete
MLSILIPCYNFSINKLVQSIHTQTEIEKINYEIICVEDGSNKFFTNNKIKKFKNVKYIINKENFGRSKIRNFLAKKAKYNWLLFIDCDSTIENKYFIKNYLNNTKFDQFIIYGKTTYQKEKPKKNKILHWTYGREIEAKRKKKTFSSHHFLIQKKIFCKFKFNEKIKKYGHEDTIFWLKLKQKNYKFKYIENSLMNRLENSKIFIKKTNEALNNLYQLSKTHDLSEISLIKFHRIIKMFLLKNFIVFIFKSMKSNLIKNLLSKNPNMLLFQFYKIGYYCKITKSN